MIMLRNSTKQFQSLALFKNFAVGEHLLAWTCSSTLKKKKCDNQFLGATLSVFASLDNKLARNQILFENLSLILFNKVIWKFL